MTLRAGLVLAGGPGRRLGLGWPKALASIDGITLVERAVAAVACHCETVVVVSRPDIALPPLDARVALDRPGPTAPLVALASGLAAVDADDVLVLACDLPLAGPLLERLLVPVAATAVARTADGRVQPLCARYPRVAASAACEQLLAAGELRAGALVDALAPTFVVARDDELLNVNRPEDLARAELLLRGRPA